MSTESITRITSYLRDALSGLGILYVLHLSHITNLTVDSMEISPAQARAIQGNLEYGTETLTPARRGAR